MNTLASLSNTSGAKNRPFVICCASATVELPTTEWLGDSKQHCSYLVPPTMDDSKVISNSDDLEKILVVDMGGLGRALEFLDRVLKEERGEYSLADLRGKVYSRLREEHPDWDEYSVHLYSFTGILVSSSSSSSQPSSSSSSSSGGQYVYCQ